jgi:hypothetical protein
VTLVGSSPVPLNIVAGNERLNTPIVVKHKRRITMSLSIIYGPAGTTVTWMLVPATGTKGGTVTWITVLPGEPAVIASAFTSNALPSGK